MPDGLVQNTTAPESGGPTPTLFDRLPPDIVGGLTARQRSAIAAAAGLETWQKHPVNIRLSLPLLPRRWYFTIVGGPERRAAVRRRAERNVNPLRTAGNVAFIMFAATLFYGFAILGLLFSSSVFS